MSATQAGWETGASATPSTFGGRSAEGACWGFGPFTCTQTRRGTHFLRAAMMPSATQVGHHELTKCSQVNTHFSLSWSETI